MAHSLKHVDQGFMSVVEEIARFNRPGQQTIRRIELHGWRGFLDAATPIIRKSLSPGVGFYAVETVSSIIPQTFGWNGY
jgi:hypothetical protein